MDAKPPSVSAKQFPLPLWVIFFSFLHQYNNIGLLQLSLTIVPLLAEGN